MDNRIGEIHLTSDDKKIKIIGLGENKRHHKTYYVQLETGEISKKNYIYYHIKNKQVSSINITGKVHYKHPLYQRWRTMMNRCYKENDVNYKNYGAKGITVHEQWHDFWNFVDDVDNRLENGHLLYENRKWQLDKDKNGGKIYSLENCVVLSAKENLKLKHHQ